MTCEERGRYLSEVHDTPISGCSFQEMDSYKSERNGKPIIVTPLFCVKCGNISEGWNYA